jgi:hypothetical protein
LMQSLRKLLMQSQLIDVLATPVVSILAGMRNQFTTTKEPTGISCEPHAVIATTVRARVSPNTVMGATENNLVLGKGKLSRKRKSSEEDGGSDSKRPRKDDSSCRLLGGSVKVKADENLTNDATLSVRSQPRRIFRMKCVEIPRRSPRDSSSDYYSAESNFLESNIKTVPDDQNRRRKRSATDDGKITKRARTDDHGSKLPDQRENIKAGPNGKALAVFKDAEPNEGDHRASKIDVDNRIVSLAFKRYKEKRAQKESNGKDRREDILTQSKPSSESNPYTVFPECDKPPTAEDIAELQKLDAIMLGLPKAQPRPSIHNPITFDTLTQLTNMVNSTDAPRSVFNPSIQPKLSGITPDDVYIYPIKFNGRCQGWALELPDGKWQCVRPGIGTMRKTRMQEGLVKRDRELTWRAWCGGEYWSSEPVARSKGRRN